MSREVADFNKIIGVISEIRGFTANLTVDMVEAAGKIILPTQTTVEYRSIPDPVMAEAKHGAQEKVQPLDYNPNGTAIPIEYGRVIKERRMQQIAAEVEALS